MVDCAKVVRLRQARTKGKIIHGRIRTAKEGTLLQFHICLDIQGNLNEHLKTAT